MWIHWSYTLHSWVCVLTEVICQFLNIPKVSTFLQGIQDDNFKSRHQKLACDQGHSQCGQQCAAGITVTDWILWHQQYAFPTAVCSPILFHHYEYLFKTHLLSWVPSTVLVRTTARDVGVWSSHVVIRPLTTFCLPSTVNTQKQNNRDDESLSSLWLPALLHIHLWFFFSRKFTASQKILMFLESVPVRLVMWWSNSFLLCSKLAFDGYFK